MSSAALPTLPLRRRLGRSDFLHFAQPPALHVQAVCGTLWVTVDGLDEDIQIEAGAGRVFDGSAAVTIGTLGGSAVLSATPLAPRPAWPQRSWLALRARLGLARHGFAQ